MFTLICARINGSVNNREAGDLRRYRTHYDVIVMDLNFRGTAYSSNSCLRLCFLTIFRRHTPISRLSYSSCCDTGEYMGFTQACF